MSIKKIKIMLSTILITSLNLTLIPSNIIVNASTIETNMVKEMSNSDLQLIHENNQLNRYVAAVTKGDEKQYNKLTIDDFYKISNIIINNSDYNVESFKFLKNLKSIMFDRTNETVINNIVNRCKTLPNLTAIMINNSKINSFDFFHNLKFQLKALVISGCMDINGNKLKEIPNEIYELRNLTELSIYAMNIDKISTQIGNLTNLKKIKISRTNIQTLPYNFYNLTQLNNIDLSNNKLSKLDNGISKLVNLSSLVCNNNNITYLPDDIVKLSNLKEVNFSNNKIVNTPIRTEEFLKKINPTVLQNNKADTQVGEDFSTGINSFKMSTSTPTVGSNVTLVAEGMGNTPLQYRFRIKDNKSGYTKTLRDFDSSNTYVWKPCSAGNKTLYVDIKNKFGSIISSSIVTDVINPLKLTSFNVSNDFPTVNSKVTLKATTTGGKNVKYTFKVKDENGNIYTLVKDSTNSSYVWTPTVKGYKILICEIKDETGKTITDYAKATVINPLTINSLDINSRNVSAGNNIILKTSASGGVETLKYRYRVKGGNTEKILRDYSTDSSYIWKTQYVGFKTIYVDVKDSIGNVVTKTINCTVTNPVIINSLSAKYNALKVGSNIEFRTSASGNGTLLYRYRVKDNATGNIYTLKDYNSSSVCNWKPSKTGFKTIYVDVKDSKGYVSTIYKVYNIKK